MTTYVGIDVGKRQHKALLLDAAGATVQKAFPVNNDRAGMDGLLQRLGQVTEPLEIGLEATGHYWLVLYDQLTRAGYRVHVLNPLQVHAYQRSGIRKRKSDTIDAWWIADFLRVSGNRQPPTPHLHRLQLQLRQVARFRFSLSAQIGNAKRRLLTVLDRVFPEYESLFSDVFLSSSRKLLSEAVMPEDLVAFDLSELTRLLSQASRGRFGQDKALEIQTRAQTSIGLTFLADAARLEMGCLLAQLDFLEQQVAEVDRTLEQLVAALPDHYLTTIPGIGAVVAATLLGEIGDIQRFPSMDKLVAYAGIDPATYQSGQFQADEVHMSKRGSPHLRQALWLAATNARRHDPQLRAEGKPYGVAMGAVCRKLLQRIFVVLRHHRPYVIRDLP